YFQGNSSNNEAANAAISQGNFEKRSLKRRHRDLVDNGFAGQRLQLGNNLKCRTLPEKHWAYLFRRISTLPGHCRAALKRSHQVLGERHMAGKECPHTSLACRFQDL